MKRSALYAFMLIVGFLFFLGYIQQPCNSQVCVKKALQSYVTSGLTTNIDQVFNDEMLLGGMAVPHSADPDIARKQFAKIFQQNTDEGSAKRVRVSALIDYTIGFFLAGTEFENHYTINSTPKDDSINFYILRDDKEKVAPNLKLGCQYIGWSNAIVCDEAFFRGVLTEIDSFDRTIEIAYVTPSGTATSAPFTNAARSIVKSALLTWIVGHEIGHAILHRRVVNETKHPLHFSGFKYDKIEREADIFVSKKIGIDTSFSSQFKIGMDEALQQEFRKYIDKQAKIDYEDGASGQADEVWYDARLPLAVPVSIPSSITHYPLVLRELGILIALTDTFPNLDNTGFYRAINSKLPSPIDVNAF